MVEWRSLQGSCFTRGSSLNRFMYEKMTKYLLGKYDSEDMCENNVSGNGMESPCLIAQLRALGDCKRVDQLVISIMLGKMHKRSKRVS